MIAAFYTSIRGAYLLVTGALFYAKEMGWIGQDVSTHSASLLFNGCQAAVAIVGFYYQVKVC